KDNKDKSEQNQSKLTRNGKDKTRERKITKAGSARQQGKKVKTQMKVKGSIMTNFKKVQGII
ncbi:hypothetical protein Tco_1535018, partial [Tanacetum coccineum]